MISPLSVRYSSEPILLRVYANGEGEGGDEVKVVTKVNRVTMKVVVMAVEVETMTMKVVMKVSVNLENFSNLSN